MIDLSRFWSPEGLCSQVSVPVFKTEVAGKTIGLQRGCSRGVLSEFLFGAGSSCFITVLVSRGAVVPQAVCSQVAAPVFKTDVAGKTIWSPEGLFQLGYVGLHWWFCYVVFLLKVWTYKDK